MKFLDLVFVPLSVFISRPLLALVPAAVFALLYRASGRRLAAAAAVLWILYTPYEYGMHRRWLCTGECNIRVDLLLLYPLLWIVSLAAVIAGILAIRRPRPKA
jgi:hypothetical protein